MTLHKCDPPNVQGGRSLHTNRRVWRPRFLDRVYWFAEGIADPLFSRAGSRHADGVPDQMNMREGLKCGAL